MAENEKTAPEVASIASRILSGGKVSLSEIKTLAASALTQAPDKEEGEEA